MTVYSVHPGTVKTELSRNWKIVNKPYIKPFILMLAFLFCKDFQQGAQTSIYCSVAEELEGVSGLFYSECKVQECNKLAKDPGLAKKLWDSSERMTGEKWTEY